MVSNRLVFTAQHPRIFAPLWAFMRVCLFLLCTYPLAATPLHAEEKIVRAHGLSSSDEQCSVLPLDLLICASEPSS